MNRPKRGLGRTSPVSWLNFRLAAEPPFTDPAGGKGFWQLVARAPKHRVAKYRIERSGIGHPWRIALLADLHVGGYADDVARYRHIVAETSALAPDLVLLLGDYMNMMGIAGGRVPPETIAGVLAGLRAPAGVFGVLGNHDMLYGREPIEAAFRVAGLVLIDNRIAVAEREGERLALVGLEDDRWGEPDLSLFGRLPEDVPAVAVTHDPGLLHDIPEGHLVVAGHMHAGQIRWPGLPPPVIPSGRAPRAWAHGHVRAKGCDLVVSAGLGVSGFPLRLGARPEIVLLELVPPSAPDR